MKALVVILALATPAAADHEARMSAGVGFGYHNDALDQAFVEHFALGARIAKGDWITASFGRLFGGDTNDLFAFDEHLWEVRVSGSRMSCGKWNPWLCGVYGAGIGYQNAGKTEVIDDIPPFTEPDVVYDLDNVFAEGHLAVRLKSSYVWFDLWVAVRLNVQLDRSSPGDDIGIGPTVGAMLSITP